MDKPFNTLRFMSPIPPFTPPYAPCKGGDEEGAEDELGWVDEEERGGVVRHRGGGLEDRLFCVGV